MELYIHYKYKMITFSYLIFPNFFVCFLDGLWISQHLIFICPYFQDWLENVFKHQDFNITLLLKKFLNKLRTFFASFAQKISFYNICICSQRPVFNRLHDYIKSRSFNLHFPLGVNRHLCVYHHLRVAPTHW